KKTNVANVLHEIAEKNHRRSLVVIFSDMFDQTENSGEIFKALQHLKHNQHEVLLFHVKDFKTEHDFQFEERPYEFIDLETGDKLKLKPSQVRETYINDLREYYKELKLKCAQYKIDFIEADINEDLNNILRAYMIKRTRLK
ncbi:MAG: DUF58 domain-containing protein, partial [Cyclobacteriaceae bacterium]|nr:DUF58 domain-containing protein [Cyclobacteriaceae bacterium]